MRTEMVVELGSGKVSAFLFGIDAHDFLVPVNTDVPGMGVVPSQGIEYGLVTSPFEAHESICAAIAEATQGLTPKKYPSKIWVTASGDLTFNPWIVPDPRESKIASMAKAIKKAGVGMQGFVSASLAVGCSLLTHEEREKGAVIVDIGFHTTTISCYKFGALYASFQIPLGGFNVTRQLSISANVPFYYAEELKMRHGHAVPARVDDEEIPLPSFAGSARRDTTRRALCQPLYEASRTIWLAVKDRLENKGISNQDNSVFLTGGGSMLPGMYELGKDIFSRLQPGVVHAQPMIPDPFCTASFSAIVGAACWVAQTQK